MKLKFSKDYFTYASFLFSLSFWFALILSHVPVVPKINIPGIWGLAIMGLGVVFAGAAAVCRSILWPLTIPLALGSFFFVMFVIGS